MRLLPAGVCMDMSVGGDAQGCSLRYIGRDLKNQNWTLVILRATLLVTRPGTAAVQSPVPSGVTVGLWCPELRVAIRVPAR